MILVSSSEAARWVPLPIHKHTCSPPSAFSELFVFLLKCGECAPPNTVKKVKRLEISWHLFLIALIFLLFRGRSHWQLKKQYIYIFPPNCILFIMGKKEKKIYIFFVRKKLWFGCSSRSCWIPTLLSLDVSLSRQHCIELCAQTSSRLAQLQISHPGDCSHHHSAQDLPQAHAKLISSQYVLSWGQHSMSRKCTIFCPDPPQL